MPTYDTKCEKCELVQEVVHRMSEDHPPCKECGGKLYTYFAPDSKFTKVVFKGKGWADKERRGG
jgi:putative FmdB family regulatory protein